MGIPSDLLRKAEQAQKSAWSLLDAGDADGACSRACTGLFVLARACLIADGGTTGDELTDDRGNVVRALRDKVDPALWWDLFGAWNEAETLEMRGDYGSRATAPDKAKALLERIDALTPALLRRFKISRRKTAEKTVLTVTTEDSASGHIIHAGIGTRVVAVCPMLVWGALPGAESYFAPRRVPSLAELEAKSFANVHWFTPRFDRSPRNWPGLRGLMRQHRRIHLRADPDPNSQLVLMFLFDYLRDDEALLKKICFYQSPTRLGESVGGKSLISVPPFRPIGPDDAALAARIWSAYAAPTPEALPAFLDADLPRFPFLRAALLALLEELPGAQDGLGATQRQLLRWVTEGDKTPQKLFAAQARHGDYQTYGYWQIGALLDELGRGERPAIAGVIDGPFALDDLHRDLERHRRYAHNPLSLTEFGRALLDGKADFADENRIAHRWSGWRWDGVNRQLIQR